MSEERVVLSPDTERENRIPPGQKNTESWPVLHYGAMPSIDIAKWNFSIAGLIREERSFSHKEFLSLPQLKVFSDIHCGTKWSRLDNLWEGVSTSVLHELVSILPEARFVIIYSADDFTTSLSLRDFFESDVLLATKHDGELLTPEHGYPVRMVVPRLYLWKSAKWVTGIEFVAKDKLGLWESTGYHNHGDPWKEERYGQ